MATVNPTEEKQAREIIKKIVLLNAVRYEGKATPKRFLANFWVNILSLEKT